MSISQSTVLRQFLYIGVGVFLLLVIGTLGYAMLEGWSLLDGLYMTIITIAAVGYREVGPLSQFGKLFTMVLILGGVTILAMWVGSVTTVIFQREYSQIFRKRRMQKAIKKLTGHTILCGAGETGQQIITEFLHSNSPLVVIEEDEQVVAELREKYPELPVIQGDATKDEELCEANIENARGLITALSDDVANLFVVISARTLKPGLIIITRAIEPESERKMRRAGATQVVSPNITEGSRMAAMMLRPTVVSFLDVVAGEEGMRLRLEDVRVPIGSPIDGKTLQDIQIPQRTGLIVIAIKKSVDAEGTFIYNPQSSTVIHMGDELIVLGEQERVDKLREYLKAEV